MLRAHDWLDEMLFFGGFDVAFPRHVGTLVQPGEWALDLGAQKGWFSLLLGRAVGAGGRVLAFEPDPRAYAHCVANRDRNGMTQIVALPLAAGDEDGTIQFFLNETLGWSSRFPSADQQAQLVREVTVRVAPVDAVLAEHRQGDSPAVSLVKIDVEGSEVRALRGMRALLERETPTLWLEINRTALAAAGTSAADIESMLAPLGYRFAWPEWSDPVIGSASLTYHPLESLNALDRDLFDVIAYAPRYAERAHRILGW